MNFCVWLICLLYFNMTSSKFGDFIYLCVFLKKNLCVYEIASEIRVMSSQSIRDINKIFGMDVHRTLRNGTEYLNLKVSYVFVLLNNDKNCDSQNYQLCRAKS